MRKLSIQGETDFINAKLLVCSKLKQIFELRTFNIDIDFEQMLVRFPINACYYFPHTIGIQFLINFRYQTLIMLRKFGSFLVRS